MINEDAYSFLFDVIYPYELGDLNNDGTINVADISSMLSIILDNDSPEFDPYYSDLNFDEQINIFDLIILFENIFIPSY